ncbi:Hypothetical_protein [Hexamita inflata]|uniref:Hypothetical_protein n=1 Tax=Hexamita inflata TaxID=28002 RepID=A0AA86VDY4_9EUKA|nr:Hypothetical protein HINF_LOCUS43203 [Hexamita inflata]CAI9963868.1 Hypothetical protein HINF_LOCUS51513 [Hexamita inflata]
MNYAFLTSSLRHLNQKFAQLKTLFKQELILQPQLQNISMISEFGINQISSDEFSFTFSPQINDKFNKFKTAFKQLDISVNSPSSIYYEENMIKTCSTVCDYLNCEIDAIELSESPPLQLEDLQ